MPAKAVDQPADLSTDPPPSRASPLPQFSVPGTGPADTLNPLWELACLRKRWISQQIYSLSHRLREQAHSHSFRCQAQDWRTPSIPCGSVLACESGGSANRFIHCHTAFAGKPAPTVFGARHRTGRHPQSPVGAGLPAKAVDQPTDFFTDPPPSRASPLPQFPVPGTGLAGPLNPLWELACLRRRWVRFFRC